VTVLRERNGAGTTIFSTAKKASGNRTFLPLFANPTRSVFRQNVEGNQQMELEVVFNEIRRANALKDASRMVQPSPIAKCGMTDGALTSLFAGW